MQRLPPLDPRPSDPGAWPLRSARVPHGRGIWLPGGGGGMSGPQPGDLWRPSVRHAETAAVENVEPDGTIHWRDRHGDVYRSSADAWREWVERTGARREVG